MAATGFTPISLYYSTTASAAPTAGNLVNGELAINITDGRLYYKDNAGVVKVIAGAGGAGVVAGSNTQVQYNNNGVFGASANMTFNGTTLTVADLTDSSLIPGRVVFPTTGGNLTGSANLFWDNTNSNLGIGTSSPTGIIQLTGSSWRKGVLETTGTTAKVYQGSDGNGLNFTTNIYWSGSAWVQDDATRACFAYIQHLGNQRMEFRVAPAGAFTGWTTAMTIDTSSNVVAAGSSTATAFIPSGSSVPTNGLYLPTTNTLGFSTGTTERMRLDASGNLGLGVTPYAWGSTYRALDYTTGCALYGSGVLTGLASNAHFNGTNWLYKSSTSAGRFDINGNSHQWFTAASGTAGNAITFTQAMTLDASGNLLVGTTTATGRLTIRSASTGNNIPAYFGASDANVTGVSFRLFPSSNLALLSSEWSSTTTALGFGLGGNEYMRVTTAGNVGIGITSTDAGERLRVYTTSGNTALTVEAGGVGPYIRLLDTGSSEWAMGIPDSVNAFTIVSGRNSSSAGTERMRIDSSGNVGIGTSSPSTRLHVVGTTTISTSTSATVLNVQNSSGTFEIQQNGNDAYLTNYNASGSAILRTNGTERMRLDSSGNLGLGVTPSAWGGGKAIQLTGGYVQGFSSTEFDIGSNVYFSGSNHIYSANGLAALYRQTVGTHRWYNAPSGTAGNVATFTQAMTLDASGNLGIGTTSPSTKLQVNDTITIGTADKAVQWLNGGTALADIRADSSSNLIFRNTSGYTERMRISAAGGLSVGTTADPGAGAIFATGNITAFYSSDRAFKENIQDVPNALDKVCAIGTKTFDWTDEYIAAHGGEDGYFVQKSDFGVVAQDVQAVFPQAVRTRQDGTLAVDYEKLATLAFGAIKELAKRVEALESK